MTSKKNPTFLELLGFDSLAPNFFGWKSSDRVQEVLLDLAGLEKDYEEVGGDSLEAEHDEAQSAGANKFKYIL